MITINSRWCRSPVAKPEWGGGSGIVIALVVAVAQNGVIGRGGTLPWRLASDLKLFRRLTMGKPIVMGRRTWQSLPKSPLDGRDNIVVSRDPNFTAKGAYLVTDCAAALVLGRRLASERGVGEVAVIGGAALYEEVLTHAQRIYWTSVHGCPEGDTKFPEFDLSGWETISEEPIPKGPKDEFEATLKVLERLPDGLVKRPQFGPNDPVTARDS